MPPEKTTFYRYFDIMITNRQKEICRLVAGKRVLDVGCVNHNARLREKLSLHHEISCAAAKVIGLDYEQFEVEAMRAEGHDVVVGDACDFSLGQQFDVVVAGELIEHLLNVRGFLLCCRTHLKDGGTLVLTTPNGISLAFGLESILLGREFNNPDHCCLYSATTISLLLKKCGFEVEKIDYIAQTTHHDCRFFAFLAKLKVAVERIVGLVRPNLCSTMIVVAKKGEGSVGSPKSAV